MYDPQAYWDEALSGDLDLRRISFPTFPTSLNRAMYRSMTRAVDRVLAAERVDPWAKRVLDVGCGVGVWIDYWLSQGARQVVGVDITSAGFDQLRARFSELELVQADIGDEQIPLTAPFGIVSAMNMLLHITDDHRWEQALQNLARLVQPDGLLLIMDPVAFAQDRGRQSPIERRRHISVWRQALKRNGMEIVRVEPATVLLATPVDTRTRFGYSVMSTYWRGLMKAATGERVGHLVGVPLGLMDRVLTRVIPRGPTSKCLAVRHATRHLSG